MVLLRYSKRLNVAGKHEEALSKSTEAIGIDSQLVNVKRVFLPDFAKALIYHAYSLLGTGRFQPSLDHINRAVQISRQLVEESKDQYTPLLSKALNFLSVCLYEHHRYEDSVKAAREAIQIRRMLLELRPTEFSYALTDSLNNLSLSLGELWQYDEALTVSREAIEIARARLAKEPSDPSKWLLAQCLEPFAEHLKGLGKMAESVSIARETIVLIRSLAADNEALRTDLSEALLNVGKGLTELGDLEPALENLKESVAIRRVLVESYQRVQLPLLAESLDWMGWCLMGMGRRAAALHAAQESVDLFNYALTNSDCPDAFRMGLIMALSLRSRCLRLAGRSKEALTPAREGCELLGSFPPHYPPLSIAYVTGTVLRAYSSALLDGGQNELAAQKARESLEARKKLPAQYCVDKSESLMKYAQALGETGHLEKGHRVGTEGIAILRPISELRPGINRTSLAKGLLKLCRIDAKMEGHKLACVGLAQEAVDLLRLQPETFGPELAEALHELALAFQRDSKYREALGAAKEALELRLVWDEEGTIRGFGALVEESKALVQRLSEEGVIHASPTPRSTHLQLQEDLARYSPKRHTTLP
jgi:tetratricopeptide (TPR) repeat protein